MRARLPARRPVETGHHTFALKFDAPSIFVTIRLGRLAEQAKEREKGLLDRLRE